MVKSIQLCIVAFIFTCSSTAFAQSDRYGIIGNFKNIDQLEHDEGTSEAFDTISYGLVHTRPIDQNNNRWRWWLGLNYLSDSADSSAKGLHQDIENYEFRLVPQYAVGKWEMFTPYIGAGLSMGYSQYTNRWEMINGVRQGNQLDDIEQFELGGVISFATVIKVGGTQDAYLQIIPQASYIQPIYNDGLGGLELSIAFLF